MTQNVDFINHDDLETVLTIIGGAERTEAVARLVRKYLDDFGITRPVGTVDLVQGIMTNVYGFKDKIDLSDKRGLAARLMKVVTTPHFRATMPGYYQDGETVRRYGKVYNRSLWGKFDESRPTPPKPPAAKEKKRQLTPSTSGVTRYTIRPEPGAVRVRCPICERGFVYDTGANGPDAEIHD